MILSRDNVITVSGLRTRYVPKTRIGHGLISMGPWIDIVLIVFFCVLIEGNYVVEPGVSIELPVLTTAAGAPSAATAIVLSRPSAVAGEREEIVVFDDGHYRISDPAQLSKLEEAWRVVMKGQPTATLLLEADHRVAHGTLVTLYDVAQRAGVSQISLASRFGVVAE